MANQQTVRALHLNHDTDASEDTTTMANNPDTVTIPASSSDQDVMNIGSAYDELMINNGALLGYAAVAIVLGIIIGRIFSGFVRGAGQKIGETRLMGFVLICLSSPLTLIGFSAGLGFARAILDTGPVLNAYVGQSMSLLYIVAIFWFLMRVVGYVDVIAKKQAEEDKGSEFAKHMAPAIRKTLRAVLFVLAVMSITDAVFQQSIGAWLAGFGVVGLAVSLAAQDSLKCVFGAITIFGDKPFTVGQRISFAGYDAVVERIGFRSLKVRTLTGHLVTIPNSKIIDTPVENIAERPSIRRLFKIGLTYDTTPEKMEEAIEIIKGVLEDEDLAEPIHQTINGDEFPPRVYFTEFNSYSLDILVLYWFAPPAYWNYLEHGQQVNLRIMKRLNDAGISFAFPTQTVHVEGMATSDVPSLPGDQ